MESNKGNANMWWIIIGAVIALVVMIVLLVLFTGKTSLLEEGLLDCSGKGGYCTFCNKELANNCKDRCESTCSGENYESCSYTSAFSCPDAQGCCLGTKT